MGAGVQWAVAIDKQLPVEFRSWLTLDETLADSLLRVCPVRSHSIPWLAEIPPKENIRPGRRQVRWGTGQRRRGLVE